MIFFFPRKSLRPPFRSQPLSFSPSRIIFQALSLAGSSPSSPSLSTSASDSPRQKEEEETKRNFLRFVFLVPPPRLEK